MIVSELRFIFYEMKFLFYRSLFSNPQEQCVQRNSGMSGGRCIQCYFEEGEYADRAFHK